MLYKGLHVSTLPFLLSSCCSILLTIFRCRFSCPSSLGVYFCLFHKLWLITCYQHLALRSSGPWQDSRQQEITSSPYAPVCSHSPDAVPIDSSVHQVLFKCGPPSLRWTTSSSATTAMGPWHGVIGWPSRWHPAIRSRLSATMSCNLCCPVWLSTFIFVMRSFHITPRIFCSTLYIRRFCPVDVLLRNCHTDYVNIISEVIYCEFIRQNDER